MDKEQKQNACEDNTYFVLYEGCWAVDAGRSCTVTSFYRLKNCNAG